MPMAFHSSIAKNVNSIYLWWWDLFDFSFFADAPSFWEPSPYTMIEIGNCHVLETKKWISLILPYQIPLNVFSMLHVVDKEYIISKYWFLFLLIVVIVEVSQFLESDLPGANSFGYFEACKSGANSFFPEPIPLELGSPTPKSTLFC